MSLSDARVRDLLREKFVCVWANLADEPAAGSSRAHPCTDQARDLARGLGEHNTQTLVLTPDGRLLSALAGYVGPADLAEELHFGLGVWAAARQAPEDARAGLVARAHLARARDFAGRPERTDSVGAEERFFSRMWTVGNQRGVADHQFSAAHALLPADQFSTGLMVGNNQSWFVSETNNVSTNPTSPLPSAPVYPGWR